MEYLIFSLKGCVYRGCQILHFANHFQYSCNAEKDVSIASQWQRGTQSTHLLSFCIPTHPDPYPCFSSSNSKPCWQTQEKESCLLTQSTAFAPHNSSSHSSMSQKLKCFISNLTHCVQSGLYTTLALVIWTFCRSFFASTGHLAFFHNANAQLAAWIEIVLTFVHVWNRTSFFMLEYLFVCLLRTS